MLLPPPGTDPCPNYLIMVGGKARRMCISGERWRSLETGNYLREWASPIDRLQGPVSSVLCEVCRGQGWVYNYPVGQPEQSPDWSRLRGCLKLNTGRRWERKKQALTKQCHARLAA